VKRLALTLIVGLAGSGLVVGCANRDQTVSEAARQTDAAEKGDAPREAPNGAMGDLSGGSPELARFREQLLLADEAQWRALDMNYLAVAAALDRTRVERMDYYRSVEQTRNADADVRANAFCELAASKRSAAIDHLARALREEPDPYNRTIAVWCLRTFDDRSRVAPILTEYLRNCRDIDLGRYIEADGSIRAFRSPFPLAAFEAFKGLVQYKGKDYMLDGDGWRMFVERATQHLHPEPITAIDFERLQGGTEPRTDPDARLRQWIEEMREP
jgi:hypothetical protein